MAIQLPYTDGIITPVGVSNLESKDNKGAPNGYAPLDANAKVPAGNLPVVDVSGQIATHNSGTTSVHGIADTSALIHARDNTGNDQAYGPNTDKIVTFNQSVANGINSEIGYWGFGVENANGKNAYIEPEGLHVGYASTSVSIESNKIQFGSGGSINLSGGSDYVEEIYNGDGKGAIGGSIDLRGGGGGGDGSAGAGGTIEMIGGPGDDGSAGNGGSIQMNGGIRGGHGGLIIANGANEGCAGTLNMSATYNASAGSINTSSGGGSINTSGLGYDNNTQTIALGGSINTSAGPSGAGGSIDLSNGGASITSNSGESFVNAGIGGGIGGGTGEITMMGGNGTPNQNGFTYKIRLFPNLITASPAVQAIFGIYTREHGGNTTFVGNNGYSIFSDGDGWWVSQSYSGTKVCVNNQAINDVWRSVAGADLDITAWKSSNGTGHNGGASGSVIMNGGDGSGALYTESNQPYNGGSAGSINTSAKNGFSGGNINTSAIVDWHSDVPHGNGGSIDTRGSWREGGSINTSNGGYISTAGGSQGSSSSFGNPAVGGYIDTSGGNGEYDYETDAPINGVAGGSINTSVGGGSIDTRGTGSIQLGYLGTRTTLSGSASGADKTITLPNATGTIALTNHTHGNLTSDGKVGSTANLPLITTTSGAITTGSFGTTANTFCQGDDSRLSNNRAPTAHTHAISDVTNLQTTLNAKRVYSYTPDYFVQNYNIPASPNTEREYALIVNTTLSSYTLNIPQSGNGVGDIIRITNLAQSISPITVKEIPASGATGSDPVVGEVNVGTTRSWVRLNTGSNAGGWRELNTPSHTHGNITYAGAIGSTANLPLITTTSGVVTTSTFGTTANSFCQGNDVRLQSAVVFKLGGEEKTAFALNTEYVYGGQLSRSSKSTTGAFTSGAPVIGLRIIGNWTIKGIVITENLGAASSCQRSYSIVNLQPTSSVTTYQDSLNINNTTNTYNVCEASNFQDSSGNYLSPAQLSSSGTLSINSGANLALVLKTGTTGSLPTASSTTTITAEVYCVPR